MYPNIIQDFTNNHPEFKFKIHYLKYTNKDISKIYSESKLIEKEINYTENYIENSNYVERLKARLTELSENLNTLSINKTLQKSHVTLL